MLVNAGFMPAHTTPIRAATGLRLSIPHQHKLVVFLLAEALAILIALITLSFQAIKAAAANPVRV